MLDAEGGLQRRRIAELSATVLVNSQLNARTGTIKRKRERERGGGRAGGGRAGGREEEVA